MAPRRRPCQRRTTHEAQLVALIAVTALAGCGGEAEPPASAPTPSIDLGTPSTTPPPTTTTPKPPPPPPPTQDPRCQPAPKGIQETLLSAVRPGWGKLTPLGRAYGVRGDEFNGVPIWFVATAFRASGGNDPKPRLVGIWAHLGDDDSPARQGLTAAVDANAQTYTVWPEGDKTKWDISVTADSAVAASTCAEAGQ